MESLVVQRAHEGLEFSYEIMWNHNFSGLSGALKGLKLPCRKICIVTDSNVAELYEREVEQELLKTGCQISTFVFPAGEENKNLNVVQQLYAFLIEKRFERKDLLIALGGGVTGDLTGFTAATYLRGIDFVQVPTTLLAQVDSSVGGKTGVDFDQYKNMVGAFYQPRLVYMNTGTLKSLPNDQFASGMGEVLKTGLIRSRQLYDWITDHRSRIAERDPAAMEYVIRECCKIKAAVVEEDPKEQGIRAILNLGHTLGHAIEKLKNFQLLHGQCVSIGIVGAAYLSFQREMLTEKEYHFIKNMNEFFQLPVSVKGLASEEILNATKSDKKMEEGRIKFILLNKIGEAVVDRSVTDQELLKAIAILNEDTENGEKK